MTSKKRSNKKNVKKMSKKGGKIVLNEDYTHNDLFEKYLLRDMTIKHKPKILYTDLDGCLPYEQGDNSKGIGLHIGQRKLLLSEVQFLTRYKAKYCIYAGSAPGHKTHFLSKLFPNIKFILIDPNKFELVLADIPNNNNITHRHRQHEDIIHIYNEFPTKSYTYGHKNINQYDDKEISDLIKFIKKSTHKIFIIEDYMNIKFSEILHKLGKSTFISDIRSSVSGEVLDFDIIWNTSMVYNWMNVLLPECTMVKFRVPFYNTKEIIDNKNTIYKNDFDISKNNGIDFVDDYKNGIFKMSKATLFIQAWKGKTSTEMRGHIKKQDIGKIISYDIKQIEGTLFYYNKVNRFCFHINENADKNLHFCNCNDCSIENNIWKEYIKKIDKTQTIYNLIHITDTITHRPLKKIHNNMTFNTLTTSIYKEMFNTTNNSTKYESKKTERGNKGAV